MRVLALAHFPAVGPVRLGSAILAPYTTSIPPVWNGKVRRHASHRLSRVLDGIGVDGGLTPCRKKHLSLVLIVELFLCVILARED